MLVSHDRKDRKMGIKNIITYCEVTDNPNILMCILQDEYDKEGEKIFVGHSDDLIKLAKEKTNAVDVQYSAASGTYALGWEDEEGKIWYGGSHPSAFINNIKHLEGETHMPDRVIEEVAENPLIEQLGDKENIYVWRPNY